jgi:hypothetical protein
MRWQYSFIGPDLLFYFVVLASDVGHFLLFVLFDLVNSDGQQIVLLLVLFGLLCYFIVLVLFLLQQILSPFL